jgi:hypothetical protein
VDFVDYHNNPHYYENLNNVTPADFRLRRADDGEQRSIGDSGLRAAFHTAAQTPDL